jgi:hypothetical protein
MTGKEGWRRALDIRLGVWVRSVVLADDYSRVEHLFPLHTRDLAYPGRTPGARPVGEICL